MWMTNNKVIIRLTQETGMILPKRFIDAQLRQTRKEVCMSLLLAICGLVELCMMEWLAAPRFILVFLALAAFLQLIFGLFGWRYLHTITKHRVFTLVHQFMEKHYGKSQDDHRRSLYTRTK